MVVEHKLGWHAAVAYPKNLVLPIEMISAALGMLEQRLESLATYGGDIHILNRGENVPLWINGTAYAPAGLYLLIQRCKDWYARCAEERRIKHGDRVSVLGSGITAVERADKTELYAVLLGPKRAEDST